MAQNELIIETVYENLNQDLNQYLVADLEYVNTDLLKIIELPQIRSEARLNKFMTVTLKRTSVNGFVVAPIVDEAIDVTQGLRIQCYISIPQSEIYATYMSHRYIQTILPSISVTTFELGKALTNTIVLILRKIGRPVMLNNRIQSDGVAVYLGILKGWPRQYNVIDTVPLLFIGKERIRAGNLPLDEVTLLLDIVYNILPTNMLRIPVLQTLGYMPLLADSMTYIGLTQILGNFAGLAVLPQEFPVFTVPAQTEYLASKERYVTISTQYLIARGHTIAQIDECALGILRIDVTKQVAT